MTLEERIDETSRRALELAWHADSAAASLERWLDLCEQQKWGWIPANLPLLIQVFGASWYFTRFVFFRGPAIAELFDSDPLVALESVNIGDRIQSIDIEQSPDIALEALRIAKNEVMLQILLAELQQLISQPELEEKLTELAELTLTMALNIYSHHIAPAPAEQLGVLGMGRMAGCEMNFGSDLDLIFVCPSDAPALFEQASRLVRSLLRGIAMAAPAGSLYEVDMRLRPHGAAGVLITSCDSFLEYHAGDREIWQRQLMTRCRPVIDTAGLAGQLLDDVKPYIYAAYDTDNLRAGIRDMRAKVEHELGSPAGRYELKRGCGGIMDIDFICHYLQLAHGREHIELQTSSTRSALKLLNQQQLLSDDHNHKLNQGYDFLKRMEGRLRVFDMKPVSSIARDAESLTTLARAMGYQDETEPEASQRLLDDYHDTTASVRRVFDEVLGTD